MISKYRSNFAELSPEASQLLAQAVLARYPEAEPHADKDPYELCNSAGLDQADVVMSLASDPSPLAVQTLEIVIGRPISRGHPCLSGPAPEPEPDAAQPRPEPKPKQIRAPRGPRRDPRVITELTPNPKQPGSKSHARYENYQVGMTVSEALAAGLTSADIAHDTKKGFIVLAAPKEN